MDEFPTAKKTAAKKTAPAAEKKPTAVVGEDAAVLRKPSLMKRLKVSLLGEVDAKTAAEGAVFDVFLPGIRDLIVDLAFGGIERKFGGSTLRRARARGAGLLGGGVVAGGLGRTNYTRMYHDEPRRMTERQQQMHEFSEVIVGSRAEGMQILEAMDEWLAEYGVVTVANFYDICSISSNEGAVNRRFGWYDLSGAHVVHVRDGHLLDLPKPERLN